MNQSISQSIIFSSTLSSFLHLFVITILFIQSSVYTFSSSFFPSLFLKLLFYPFTPAFAAGRANQFDKYNDFIIDKLGKQYDFESIMHYGRLTFSKNGKPTIVRINDESIEFGRPDDRLSTLDIAEINELYDCSGMVQVLNCGI